jgi:simple sugar transport system permease protein
MGRLLRQHEFYVAAILVGFSLLVGLVNPAFFSLWNLFALLKSSAVIGIFSLGLLLVLISGEIDISFPAIGVVALYLTNLFFSGIDYEGTVLLPFLMAAGIGVLLGSINAFVIARFQLPTLIVSLGTLSAFQGFILTFVDTKIINRLSDPMIDYSRSRALSFGGDGGPVYSIHTSVLVFFLLAVVTWILLRYTTLGRGVYALGGDRQATRRAGFRIWKIETFIYLYVGFLAGIAGLIHSAHVRSGNPFDLVGTELNVLAAVVLGGARIGGGRGTVLGTVLGVLLITVMNNSLILLGIPSYWQRFATGLVLIVAVVLPQVRHLRSPQPA